MCGLFGWNYKSANDFPMEKAVVSAVLIDNMTSRGKDSWGWHCPINGDQNKQVGSAREMLDATILASYQVIIGHTRHATTGQVTKKNAHPFRFKKIVGAHNGIVSNHFELNRKHGRNCKVDSMHLFRHWEEGLDLKEIEAYGAVAFAEHGDSVVNIAHFNGGDMCILTVSKRGKEIGLFWSSTKTACVEAARRAGLDYKIYTIVEENLYAAMDGELIETGKKFAPSRMASYRSWDDDSLWSPTRRSRAKIWTPTANGTYQLQYQQDSLAVGGCAQNGGSLIELPEETKSKRSLKLDSYRELDIEAYKTFVWEKYGYQLPSVRLHVEQELRDEGLDDDAVLQILRELDDEMTYTDDDLRLSGMVSRNPQENGGC
jgi:hypothetical protein